jgi:hypothetical protein
MDTLDYISNALDALEEAIGQLAALDRTIGFDDEGQERIFVSLRYEYDKLLDEYNAVEEGML